MSAFDIKIIAIIAMVIDHVGLAFFPNLLIFRAIGRLAFPLFAWLIANGAYHTKDIKKYLERLFIFALISQIPYMLFVNSIGVDRISLNIFFTLFLGLLVIAIYKMTNNKILLAASLIISAVFAQIIRADFGLVGVLSVFFFFIYFKDFPKLFISQFMIFTVLNSIILYAQRGNSIPDLLIVQPVTLLSLIFVYQYNNKKGYASLKYLFYLIYPVHLLIIYLIINFIK